MIKLLVVSGLVSVLATVPSARAQVTLDVSKITCEQLAGYKIHQSSKYRDLDRKCEGAAKILHSKSSNIGHECSRNIVWRRPLSDRSKPVAREPSLWPHIPDIT